MLFAVPAFGADTVTIGFTASQTGALNNDSMAQMRGIELWRDEINAKGGIKAGGKSYVIKTVSYDDESQNTRVQQLYTRLITQDKAQFLISPYSSGLVATASIISEQYEKVMITTGGTGVALRDVTPEAVREIAVRELPGFGEVMRVESMKITKNAILSRNLAVVVEKTLVICLPGKPSGAVECLGFVVDALPHCIEVLQEVPTSC
jgi:molybdenum cofactor synthesis domain-containing protein